MNWLCRSRVAGVRAADGVLDFAVLAFGAWTLIYGACLLAHFSTTSAAIAEAVAVVPCLWFVVRAPAAHAAPPVGAIAGSRLRVVNAVAGVAAAAIAAFAATTWAPVWILWLVAAGAALVCAGRGAQRMRASGGSGAVTAAVWAAGLAVMSLLLVDPNADDTHYVHQATWIAERGRFPVRDTLFSDERFQALFAPPWDSLEALAGAVARAAGTSAPGLVYLGVTPLATVLAVLALWRLLRVWEVPMPALALSTALIFLLVAACDERRTVGEFFVTRLWQGKAVFVAVLVPLLFALLCSYAEQPARRTLVLLFAAGVAAVGLTTSAIFVVPVIACGCLAPLAFRAPRRAAAAFLAVAGYPAFAGVVSLAIGARNPDINRDGEMVSGALARESIAAGAVALVIVAAALVGPALLRRRSAGQMSAGVVLVVGVLLSPGVPAILMELTGVGEALWRLVWAVPIAALVGVIATGLARSAWPAVALCAALLAWAVHVGPPAELSIAPAPAWKLDPRDLADARAILAQAQAGDLVLAPQPTSRTLLVISARVTTVDPRDFYTWALGRIPGQRRAARPRLRVHLQGFADPSVARARGRVPASTAFVTEALRVLGVDIACVRRSGGDAVRVLRGAGYARRFSTPGLACLRSPGAHADPP